MSASLSKRKYLALIGSMICAVALTMICAPAAFAGTITNPDITVSSYNAAPAVSGTDNAQHVVVNIDYGSTVAVEDADNAATGLTITIAGYNITASNYTRPVTASASGTSLVLDIGNVYTTDIYGNTAAAFTAQYGGVIQIYGTPTGVTAGGTTVGALATSASPYKTVIPSGVDIAMTNAGTSSVTATVDHTANVRSMVHVIVYNRTATTVNGVTTYTYTPVNSGGTTAGNLAVGAASTHAHNFMTMTTAQLASGAYSALNAVMPSGYSMAYAAGTSSFTVSGPSGSSLYVYVFDDSMLNTLGWNFTGVVSNSGVMTEYLPAES